MTTPEMLGLDAMVCDYIRSVYLMMVDAPTPAL